MITIQGCMIAVFAMHLAISVGGANGDSCVEFAAGGPRKNWIGALYDRK